MSSYSRGKGQRLAANGIVQMCAEKCALANIISKNRYRSLLSLNSVCSPHDHDF